MGGFAVALALLIFPMVETGLNAGLYGIPTIFGPIFVDPIMGEIKRKTRPKNGNLRWIIDIICSMDRMSFRLNPILASLLLAPLTVAGEVPKLRYIDDNATMVLFPFCIGHLTLIPVMEG